LAIFQSYRLLEMQFAFSCVNKGAMFAALFWRHLVCCW